MRIDHRLGKEHGRAGHDARVPPVLRIAPGTGETIAFQTDDAVYRELHTHGSLAALSAPMNPVTGPVYVEGARPGDALAVTIHQIRLTDTGWAMSLPGVGALRDRMPDQVVTRRIPIDAAGVHLTESLAVPARPMVGCIGTAPASGTASTVMPAHAIGGNMDVPDIAPGATVLLPVEVEGALLAIGDVHAIMARGESSFVAIEAEGTVVVSVDVVSSLRLRAPRIRTAEEWIFVGLGATVQESVQRGYEDAFDAFVASGWETMDAYTVMSALAHSELGGPTGACEPDPLHPFDAVGAVTLHRVPRDLLWDGATADIP
ncbi:acetamidase/formamidase family protein [Microbacterium sp. SORGH_AS_0888]|uniref:acetamidase/formamidase family protein n=1 Tax=Microbacterium sp. SORGH_AS_0888 TaxID=3041791 RepID=UPI002784DF10|nr:acetamidase/formamidase family protein [Microbacterium sp. SORGH_AS_0888]MDQ1128948.1 amidase [Microbacterium sp. SORGH_AS_0888]